MACLTVVEEAELERRVAAMEESMDRTFEQVRELKALALQARDLLRAMREEQDAKDAAD
jgi:hypothetical protein